MTIHEDIVADAAKTSHSPAAFKEGVSWAVEYVSRSELGEQHLMHRVLALLEGRPVAPDDKGWVWERVREPLDRLLKAVPPRVLELEAEVRKLKTDIEWLKSP